MLICALRFVQAISCREGFQPAGGRATRWGEAHRVYGPMIRSPIEMSLQCALWLVATHARWKHALREQRWIVPGDAIFE